jgi:hypothetical protein
MECYFRLGIGAEKATLTTGLARIGDALKDRFGV